MKVAALDLGTNSFLCLIGEGNSSQGLTHVIADHMEVVRLGQDVQQAGVFHVEALARAQACLERFATEIKRHQVHVVQAVATSAARDVSNGELLFKMGQSLNIPIAIIDGSLEAKVSYQGAVWGHQSKQESVCVIDVGGGSTEYIVGQGAEIQFAKSLNIGGVRLTERFINNQPISQFEQSAVKEFVQAEISKVMSSLRALNPQKIIAVAGTPTSLAAIELGGFDEKKVDGFFLSLERMIEWQKEFAATSVEEKKEKYKLGGRADIIFAGITILIESAQQLGLKGIHVSTKGVRYGVAEEVLRNPAVFQS